MKVEKTIKNEQKIAFFEEFCFENEDFSKIGLKPFSILQIFQDASTKHAEQLGVGFEAMLSKHLLWITMRIKYEILRLPQATEKLTIKTYPSGKNRMEYDREYLIFDADGNIIIKGQSKWCLINSQTRKIERMIDSPILLDQEPIYKERFLKSDDFEPKFLPDVNYQIKTDDIDNNGHTNNTVYAKMIAPVLEQHSKTINFFQINFLKESLIGERIDIYSQKENDDLLILGKKCEGEKSFTIEIKFMLNHKK